AKLPHDPRYGSLAKVSYNHYAPTALDHLAKSLEHKGQLLSCTAMKGPRQDVLRMPCSFFKSIDEGQTMDRQCSSLTVRGQNFPQTAHIRLHATGRTMQLGSKKQEWSCTIQSYILLPATVWSAISTPSTSSSIPQRLMITRDCRPIAWRVHSSARTRCSR